MNLMKDINPGVDIGRGGWGGGEEGIEEHREHMSKSFEGQKTDKFTPKE